MTVLTISETAAFLRERNGFSILTHKNPDGDTLGSAAALCRMLRALGKDAHVVPNPELSRRYTWLLEGLTRQEVPEEDTVVCVDVAASHLLPDAFLPYLSRIDLRIDHHGGRDSFSRFELVDAAAGSCTEILYDLMGALHLTPDPATADALYTGLVTDTNGFRSSNATAHSFAVAAACAAAGARTFELGQALFEVNPMQRLKLQNWIVRHHRVFAGGRLALAWIPRSRIRKIGATKDDLDNILDFPLAVTGARLAALLIETEDGKTRLSVRSVPEVDGAKLAAAFGGGGHKTSAGANMTLPLRKAVKSLETEMLRQFGEWV